MNTKSIAVRSGAGGPLFAHKEIQIHKVYSKGHYHCERDWEKL